MSVINEIQTERQRQTEVEGYEVEHDDYWRRGELSIAAACYAAPERIFIANDEYLDYMGTTFTKYIPAWPWNNDFKRKDRRYDLIRAAALIIAEIERLDRCNNKITPVHKKDV